MRTELIEHINAAFTGIWVQTHQADEAEREIRQLSREQGWEVGFWDIARGIRGPGQGNASQGGGDPLAAIRHLEAMTGGTCLLVCHNLHRFLNNAELVQVLQQALLEGKADRKFLVVLSPVVQLPPELERLFIVLEHALPDREQLRQIAVALAGPDTRDPGAGSPFPEGLDRILAAASGLTHHEAEGAMALSLTRHGEIRPEVVFELKAQALRKANLLTLHRGAETFADLGGLEAVKGFCRQALRGGPVRPRGILLLGVPGTGKSFLAKALGNEMGRPTLLLDLGSLMGSLVGQTEQNVRQALRQVDAMAPCILFCDELEKALPTAGGQGDSGVGSRLLGTLLTWLGDHTSDVFFIGTCNDMSRLPPEFTRAERFDGVFFLDLPTREEKDAIWSLCTRKFGLPLLGLPEDGSWTGAEIHACCRLAALLGVPLTEAARQIVPVAVTARESVDRLRAWATGRCLSASRPGLHGMAAAHPDPGAIPARRSRAVKAGAV
jgi:hypothetical protein